MSRYSGNIDAFPSQNKIYIALSSMDNSSDFYEIEIERSMLVLAKLMQKLRIQFNQDSQCRNYKQYANEVLKNNIGSFYTDHDDIISVFNDFQDEVSTKDRFPSEANTFVRESITLESDTMINEQIVPKGTHIDFYYEGRI